MMQLTQYSHLSGHVIHACGEKIKVAIAILGDKAFPAEVTMREGRFTFMQSFAETVLHFTVHGSRVRYCPTCKKPLPRTVEDVRDEDFAGHA